MIRTTPHWQFLQAYPPGTVAVGIDEVGRGAWAGPVVAGAVILPAGLMIDGLADSKALTARQRRQLDRAIRAQALAIGLGWVAAAEVDAHGLSWAVRQSGLRALAALGGAYDLVVLDGRHNYLAATHPSITLVKADAAVAPVAAAAIVAKVARDHYMAMLDRRHPGYGFAAHVGYGTAAHQAALAQHGPSPVHRQSYAPLKALAARQLNEVVS